MGFGSSFICSKPECFVCVLVRLEVHAIVSFYLVGIGKKGSEEQLGILIALGRCDIFYCGLSITYLLFVRASFSTISIFKVSLLDPGIAVVKLNALSPFMQDESSGKCV